MRKKEQAGIPRGDKNRFEKDFSALDNAFKALKNPEQYPIVLGPGLERLQKEVIHPVVIKELVEI